MRKTMPALAAILLALFLSAQDKKPTVSDDFISVERTHCYGSCPAYTVELHTSGKARYSGTGIPSYSKDAKPPAVKTKEYSVNPAEVRKLFDEAKRIKLTEMKEKYRCVKNRDGQLMTMTDFPTTYVRVVEAGKEKKIEVYLGGPEELWSFIDHIEKVAGVKQLVAPEGKLDRYPFAEHVGPFGTTGMPCEKE
jgi:hypothetical protein